MDGFGNFISSARPGLPPSVLRGIPNDCLDRDILIRSDPPKNPISLQIVDQLCLAGGAVGAVEGYAFALRHPLFTLVIKGNLLRSRRLISFSKLIMAGSRKV